MTERARSDLDLNLVAVFARVVAAGSFTAAAAGLGVPKSSVSRAVARLEESLGVRLLQRTTRRLGLTEAGQRYLAEVRGPAHPPAGGDRRGVGADLRGARAGAPELRARHGGRPGGRICWSSSCSGTPAFRLSWW